MASPTSIVRDQLANLFRNTPNFRGKYRLANALNRALTNTISDNDCLRTLVLKSGVRMTVDVRSETERWAYWSGRYDDKIIQYLVEQIEGGTSILDVGANVGFYSVPFARHVGSNGGKLFAFEPIDSNYQRLCACLELNGLQAYAETLKYGLGEKDEIVRMAMDSRDNASTGNAVVVKGTISEKWATASRR